MVLRGGKETVRRHPITGQVPNQPDYEGPLVFPVPGKAAAASKQRESFTWIDGTEPHAIRRKMILKAHPEIRQLYGPDDLMVFKVLGVLLLQFVVMMWVRDQSWPVFLFFTYALGGTANHALSLASHELSHNLAFKKPKYNTWLGILANFGMGFPASATFKRYHMEHHADQGVCGVDVDVPTEWEGKFFRGVPLKVLWCFLMPAFYALRPMIVRPKPPNTAEICNFALVIGSDALIVYNFGGWALGYLILSTLLGMGLHPTAGHFIAEHYEFIKGQETYSYYGCLNWVTWNVGYHNEHHDFPFVAGCNLPKVRALAPEFYDTLPHHDSWCAVIWNYIMDPSVGPYSRVKRDPKHTTLMTGK